VVDVSHGRIRNFTLMEPRRRCFFLSVLHALQRLVAQDCLVSCSSKRISEVTDVFEARAATFSRGLRRIFSAGRRGGVTSRHFYTDYGVWWIALLEADRDLPARPRGHLVIAARRRGSQRPRPRAPRVFGQVSLSSRVRAQLLAEPRAAPVLELRRLGVVRLRAVRTGGGGGVRH